MTAELASGIVARAIDGAQAHGRGKRSAGYDYLEDAELH